MSNQVSNVPLYQLTFTTISIKEFRPEILSMHSLRKKTRTFTKKSNLTLLFQPKHSHLENNFILNRLREKYFEASRFQISY